jgi:peptide/nickel transport system substrate-binding protein
MEKLRDQYARETDTVKQKALADAIQVRSIEITTHINLGQFMVVSAARKNVTGFIAAGPTVFWNVEKSDAQAAADGSRRGERVPRPQKPSVKSTTRPLPACCMDHGGAGASPTRKAAALSS